MRMGSHLRGSDKLTSHLTCVVATTPLRTILPFRELYVMTQASVIKGSYTRTSHPTPDTRHGSISVLP